MTKKQIMEVVNKFTSDGFYKGENIPPKKLSNATQNFLPDATEDPLALVDCTLTGNAKNGLIIGLKGIYFKNDWTTKTEKNFISWNELSNSTVSIQKSFNDVILLPGCPLNMATSSMNKDQLINLLNQLIGLNKALNSHQDIETTDLPKSDSSKSDYKDIIVKIIALCIAANGDVNDEEVELASVIIEDDENITDKESAINSLTENIETFIESKNKSSAMFKLKSGSIISSVSKIKNETQKEKIQIILDALLEASKNNDETNKIISSIKEKLK